MSKGVELAVGYVSIVPETSQVGPGIQRALAESSGTIARFGSIMGTELGKGIAQGVAGGSAGVFDQIVREGGRAGDRTGQGFSDHVVRHARRAGRDSGQGFFDEFKTTSERTGAIIGKILSAPMAGTVNAFQGAGHLAARAFHGALMGGLGVLGLGGGFGIATFLTKGMQRLEGLDNAQRQIERMSKQFQATGKAALDYKKIQDMLVDKDNGVLTGTPIALNEAMGAVSMALQGGIDQGKQLKDYMTALADAAGATQQPFNELAGIFNDITSKGKLETDEIMQFQNRQVDIQNALMQTFGWNKQKLDDMLKQGKVGINEVTQAIEHDMGGAAKSAGDTLQGQMANMETAIGRVGAKLISVFSGKGDDPLGGMKDVVGFITGKLDEMGVWVDNHKEQLREYFIKAKDIAVEVATAVGNIGKYLLDHPGLIKAAGVAFATWEAISVTATVASSLNAIATALRVAIPAAAVEGGAAAAAALGPLAAVVAAIVAGLAIIKATKDANVLGDDYNAQLGRRGLGALNNGHMGALGTLTDAASAGILGGAAVGAGVTPGGGLFGSAAGGGQAGGAGGTKSAAGQGLPMPTGGYGGLFGAGASTGGIENTAGITALDQFTIPGTAHGFNIVDWQKQMLQRFNEAVGTSLTISADRSGSNGAGVEKGDVGHPNDGLFHSQNRAIDISGSEAEMSAFVRWWTSDPARVASTLELIHGDSLGSSALNVKDGSQKDGYSIYGKKTMGEHFNHVHLALQGVPYFSVGGGISGSGSGTSDSIPAMLSNGEHVLTAADVSAMGGQDGVYAFRNSLHRAGGGQIDFNPDDVWVDDKGKKHHATNQLPAPDQLTKAQQETGTGSYSAAILDALQHNSTSGNVNPNWQIDTRSVDNSAGAAGPLTPLVNPAVGSNGPLSAHQPGNMRTDWINLENSMDWDKPMWSKADIANSPLAGILNHFDPEASRNKLNDTNWTEWVTPSHGEPYLQYVGTNHFARGGAVQRFSTGGKPLTPEELAALQGGQTEHNGDGAAPGPHQGTGAPPGPDASQLFKDPNADPNAALAQQETAPSFLDNLMRTPGFTPTGGGGKAGTSSLASLIGMGSDVIGGVIDTGASLAQTAVSAAITAGTMGAGAAAGPAAGAAAGYGINLAAAEGKRAVNYWFDVAGIGADALVAQLFPVGGPPRWLGYDYTKFAPQLGIQEAASTTVEQMGKKAIDDYFNPKKPGDPSAPDGQPGAQQAPVNPIAPPAANQANDGPSAPVIPAQAPPGEGTGPAPGPPPAVPTAPITPSGDGQQPDPLRNLFGFDQGGWLQPNQIGINKTGKPEPVLTPQQWDALAADPPSGGSGGPMVKIDNIYGLSPEDVADQIEQKQRLAAMQYSGRPYH